MKIILTGATGFVGTEVLRQALADPEIDEVIVLTRRPLAVSDPKLEALVLPDFLDYSGVGDRLQADACIWALGVSQTAVTSDEEYVRITFDYAMAAARAMLAANPALRFCFVSGRSADQEEKSAVLQGRIKGRTERELAKLSPNVFNFRPAFIKSSRPGVERPFVARFFEPVAGVVDRFTETFSVDCGTLARALLDVAKHGHERHLLDNAWLRQQKAG